MFLEWIENKIKGLRKEWIWAFSVTFISGIFVHIYRLTNHLLNHDVLWGLEDSRLAMGVKFGRIFMGPLSLLSSKYGNLPWINGVLSMLYLAVAVVLWVELFNVKRKTTIVLMGIVTVVFPAAASQLAYIHCADIYIITIMLATLAVFSVVRCKKFGVIIGSIILFVAIATYQSSVSVAMMLIIMLTIIKIIKGEETLVIIKSLGKFLVVGVLAMVGYIICLNAVIAITGIQLTDYMGISEMGQMSLYDVVEGIRNAYNEFAYFFFVNPSKLTIYNGMNYVCFAGLLFGLIYIFFKRKIYNNLIKSLLYFICIILTPLVCHALVLVSSDITYHMLMQWSLVLIYISVLKLMDSSETIWEGINRKFIFTAQSILVISITVLCINNYTATNIVYHDMQEGYEKTYALAIRVADRIESIDEYAENYSLYETQLYVVNYLEENIARDTFADYMPEYTGANNRIFMTTQEHFVAMLNNYLGMRYREIDEEMIPWVEYEEEFKSMKAWPAEDSVKVIRGVTVVKLGDYGYEENE